MRKRQLRFKTCYSMTDQCPAEHEGLLHLRMRIWFRRWWSRVHKVNKQKQKIKQVVMIGAHLQGVLCLSLVWFHDVAVRERGRRIRKRINKKLRKWNRLSRNMAKTGRVQRALKTAMLHKCKLISIPTGVNLIEKLSLWFTKESKRTKLVWCYCRTVLCFPVSNL